MKKLFLTLLLIFCLIPKVNAGDVSKAHTYVNGEILTAALLNASFDEIINEVNDLDGDNLASNIAITTSGNMAVSGTATFSNTFTTTGTSNNIGNGGSDVLVINTPNGITFTPAATWTFTGNQTVSGTWADLGIVTTVDINGGTIDGTTIGGTTPAAASVTTLTTNGKLTAGANEVEGSNFDINGGAIDGAAINSTTIGASTASSIIGTTIKANTTFEAASGTTINEFSIDGTMAGDSDNAVPTEKAVKTYADTKIGGFGSWAAGVFETTTTVSDDGFIVAWYTSASGTLNIKIDTDADASDGTTRSTINQSDVSITCPIKSGEKYYVDSPAAEGDTTIYFIPLQ